ncbi:MAG: metal-sensitive transcriptional regulator [Myxococcota bacterium]
MDDDTRNKSQSRLRKIAGQVKGIQRMVEQERYCVDILLQIAAVQAALSRVGKLVLGAHVETCVSDAIRSGSAAERREKIDELMEVFSRYAHLRAR